MLARTSPGDTCFPTDVLVEILLRLPPSARRRARLVCRLWRDVVDERTTEMHSRATVLLWHAGSTIAYVVDDLSSSSTGSYSLLWSGRMQLVGTCNGLLCLCDDGGSITLVNPATRETLPVPRRPPCAGQLFGEDRRWHREYNFAYHPTTGRYKVVHVPCSFNRVRDAVHVLTLGEEAWREVPAPGNRRCNLDGGIVSVDGVTYWVTDGGGTARIISFDLDSEHIATSTTPLPFLPARHNDYSLTEVHGRLGVIVSNPAGMMQAWVQNKEGRWICRYTLACPMHEIPRPHFAYGEHFLKCEGQLLYAYPRQGALSPFGSRLASNILQVNHRDKGVLVAKMNGVGWRFNYRTFAYVKTMEPLSIYMRPQKCASIC
ncbi:hypothetical protein CFC21_072671 [Triticum aestivum]|uniref:F-box domain-containing protein n=2 Tax=Triticum aestivum TaxID=4565 RepID=A0A3B6LQK3_WHEAT|nr:hypothetical protein CFC21_072671 [Triticum aestivum]